VARIASAQAKGVETGDEFADDFYNIQLTERRTHAAPASDLAGDTSNEDRPAEVLNFLKKIHRGEHVEPSALALARSGAPLPLGNLRCVWTWRLAEGEDASSLFAASFVRQQAPAAR
jgi:hypothetical protein